MNFFRKTQKIKKYIRSNIKKGRKGVTLIELLAAVTIFAIIVGAISGLFISGIRSQSRALAAQELLDQTSYVLEYMGRNLRMAEKDITGDCIPAGTNYQKIPDGIIFINHLQNDDCQSFFLQNNQLKYKKNILTAFPQTFDITSLNINVDSFKINISGEPQGDNLQPKVTLVLEVSGRETMAGQPKINIQTTISQRNLDISY
jgi:prepilin-type N-terminal cleavage/methylation domain-containing protein